MKKKKIEKLLYRSLDSNLLERESKILHDELYRSDSLSKMYLQAQRVRKAVQESGQVSFEPFFEERVLNKINYAPAAKTFLPNYASSLMLSFKQVAITAVIVLALLITYNLKSGNNYSIENLFGNSYTNIEYAFDPLQNLIGSVR